MTNLTINLSAFFEGLEVAVKIAVVVLLDFETMETELLIGRTKLWALCEKLLIPICLS
jgi:hypothetical protein